MLLKHKHQLKRNATVFWNEYVDVCRQNAKI